MIDFLRPLINTQNGICSTSFWMALKSQWAKKLRGINDSQIRKDI